MQKEDAYKILGLKKNAPRIEVEKRYSIILRKLKTEDSGVSDIDFDKATEAYNLLMGYTTEDDSIDKVPRKTSPIFKKLGIDQDKLMNNLYYFRIHIIVGIIVLLAIIFSIRGCVNRVIPDLNVVFMGDIYCSDTEKLESDIIQNIPGVNAVGIENILISSVQEKQDPQVQMAMLQKAAVLIAAGDIDIFIIDKINFDKYAVQGAFFKLDELCRQFNIDDDKFYKSKIVDEDDKDYIYGIDVLNSRMLKDAAVSGKRMIAAISVRAKNYEYAEKLVELLLEE